MNTSIEKRSNGQSTRQLWKCWNRRKCVYRARCNLKPIFQTLKLFVRAQLPLKLIMNPLEIKRH